MSVNGGLSLDEFVSQFVFDTCFKWTLNEPQMNAWNEVRIFSAERAEINFSKCHRFNNCTEVYDYTETTEMFSN